MSKKWISNIDEALDEARSFAFFLQLTEQNFCITGSFVPYLEGVIEGVRDIDILGDVDFYKNFLASYEKAKQRRGGLKYKIDLTCFKVTIEYQRRMILDREIVHEENLYKWHKGFKVLKVETLIACWVDLVRKRYYKHDRYLARIYQTIDKLENIEVLKNLKDFNLPTSKTEFHEYLKKS